MYTNRYFSSNSVDLLSLEVKNEHMTGAYTVDKIL